MFDKDLAEIYQVPTGALNRAVKRNKNRFPADFMFQLNKQETLIWKSEIFGRTLADPQFDGLDSRSQFGILKRGQNIKYAPYVFTEHGVAMLASVLNSDRAVRASIQIIRTFIRMREMLVSYKDLREKIENIEKKYDKRFRIIFDELRRLTMKEEEKPKTSGKIGFKAGI